MVCISICRKLSSILFPFWCHSFKRAVNIVSWHSLSAAQWLLSRWNRRPAGASQAHLGVASIKRPLHLSPIQLLSHSKTGTTQFEIECRCGGHSVTKQFMTIYQILVSKPKLWKKLYFYKQYIFNIKIHFFLLTSGKVLLAVPKNGQF